MHQRPPQASRPQLSWLLEQEITEMEALARLLHRESGLLLSHDPLALEQLLEAKSLKVSTLADLDQRRELFFRQLELGQDRQAVAAALDERFPPSGLGALWLRLTELAQECRRLNHLNAATVELGQHHLLQALHILRGEGPEAELYGADGEKTLESKPRLLGQA